MPDNERARIGLDPTSGRIRRQTTKRVDLLIEMLMLVSSSSVGASSSLTMTLARSALLGFGIYLFSLPLSSPREADVSPASAADRQEQIVAFATVFCSTSSFQQTSYLGLLDQPIPSRTDVVDSAENPATTLYTTSQRTCEQARNFLSVTATDLLKRYATGFVSLQGDQRRRTPKLAQHIANCLSRRASNASLKRSLEQSSDACSASHRFFQSAAGTRQERSGSLSPRSSRNSKPSSRPAAWCSPETQIPVIGLNGDRYRRPRSDHPRLKQVQLSLALLQGADGPESPEVQATSALGNRPAKRRSSAHPRIRRQRRFSGGCSHRLRRRQMP